MPICPQTQQREKIEAQTAWKVPKFVQTTELSPNIKQKPPLPRLRNIF